MMDACVPVRLSQRAFEFIQISRAKLHPVTWRASSRHNLPILFSGEESSRHGDAVPPLAGRAAATRQQLS